MTIPIERSLETLAIEDGFLRFKKDLEAKKASGLMNSAQSKLFSKQYPEALRLVQELSEEVKRGPTMQWRVILKDFDKDKLTYIVLYNMIQSVLLESSKTKSLSNITLDILNTNNIKDPPDPVFQEYLTLAIQLYTKLLELSIFEEYQTGKSIYYLTFSDNTLEELHKALEWESYMKPLWRPMVTKPKSVTEGSYIASELSKRLTLVRTFSRTQKALLEPLVSSQTPFVKACDAIQAVPLKINQWMLPILKESYELNLAIGSIPTNALPKGTTTAKRLLRSQLKSHQAAFLADLEEAKHYAAYDEVYLPVTLDFRGRVYAKPYLNHQRADYVKAIWLFAEGKPMDTPEAVEWLKIHIANTGDFDKVSKKPFSDRIQWVNDNFVRIYETIQEPFSDLWWTAADAPFSFLAGCRELVNFTHVGAKYVCHLPVAVDGSCSGLQHYSAMLRDEIGAKSVNLVHSSKPEDVYKEVANVVNQLVMQEQDDPLAKEWLNHKIDRKVTKRATMTLCYGSKQYGWREQLMEDFMSKYQAQVNLGQLDKHPFEHPGKASGFMAKKLDIALRNTVKAALEGMEWLQDVAGLLSKEEKPVIWTTPLGFPVVNEYMTPIEKVISVNINRRRVRTKLALGFTDKLKGSKQRSTIAPNFVHSYDASHLMQVVLAAKEHGIDDFLLIHDSFGCLPSDMQRFSEIVREQFVELYSKNDPFMVIYSYALSILSDKAKKKLTPPPPKGKLDLSEVLKSKYAFA